MNGFEARMGRSRASQEELLYLRSFNSCCLTAESAERSVRVRRFFKRRLRAWADESKNYAEIGVERGGYGNLAT
jgi:hypothetical protein